MPLEGIGEKIELARRGAYAIIAGILLLIAKAHADVAGILIVLKKVAEMGIISEELAEILIRLIFIIGLFGGLLVLLGGILLLTKKITLLANFLISMGSGASLLDLIFFMLFSSPTVKLIIIKECAEKASSVGANYLLLTIGTILAFLAMIRDTIGFGLGFVAGFVTNLSSSLIEASTILIFLESIAMPRPPSYMVTVIWLILFSGNIIFLAGVLYGFKKYRIGFLLNIIGVFTYIPHIMIIQIGIRMRPAGGMLPYIRGLLALIGLILAIITLVYGLVKVVMSKPTKKT